MTLEEIRCAFEKAHDGQAAKFNLEFMDGTTAKLEDLNITEWPYKLPNGTYNYSITKFSTDPISKIHQKRAVGIIMTALGLWPKNIRFRRHKANRLLHMPWKWVYDDNYLRDPGRKNVVAYTTMPTPGRIPRPIVFDEDEDWRIYGGTFKDPKKNPRNPNQIYRAQPILFVGMHEAGHWINLVHTLLGTGTIMDPIIPNNAIPLIGPITQKRIENSYDKRSLPMWLINHIRQKRLSKAYFN